MADERILLRKIPEPLKVYSKTKTWGMNASIDLIKAAFGE
jgi:hypothetical protein